jgi:hypothetical protein
MVASGADAKGMFVGVGSSCTTVCVQLEGRSGGTGKHTMYNKTMHCAVVLYPRPQQYNSDPR